MSIESFQLILAGGGNRKSFGQVRSCSGVSVEPAHDRRAPVHVQTCSLLFASVECRWIRVARVSSVYSKSIRNCLTDSAITKNVSSQLVIPKNSDSVQ
ncbi:hypothetical protein LSTR_LSTR017107 [Laodelphax striatellus]|uniref:Uncharacterized protein n=1 Tax=Laodelphax striatellus TaxID=195883 RepID=A0A482XNM4_LAOST|nr:hypothetical protein LSTR_LSTR017107 [Laodelphax striatellus]